MNIEKKFYLTAKGLENIKKEYKVLRALRAVKIDGEAPRVLESEDLNPEFVSFREDVGLLDQRIAELENILKNVKLIKFPSKEKRNIIRLGADVVVDVGGNKDEFKIVGTLEANPSLGKISNESPVGRALLGRRVGDEAVISSPIEVIYKIKKIRYES